MRGLRPLPRPELTSPRCCSGTWSPPPSACGRSSTAPHSTTGSSWSAHCCRWPRSPLGRPGPLHSLVTAVAVLALVMLTTQDRRLVRRRWLGIPIGLFCHLVFSGVWADTQAFWWPLIGLGLSSGRPPELARGAITVVLESPASGSGSGGSAGSGSTIPSTAPSSDRPDACPGHRRRRWPARADHRPPRSHRGQPRAVGCSAGSTWASTTPAGRQAAALAAHIGPVDRIVIARRCAGPRRPPPRGGSRSRSTSDGSNSTTASSTACRCADVDPPTCGRAGGPTSTSPRPAARASPRSGGVSVRRCDELRDEAAERDVVVVPTCRRSRPRWRGPSASPTPWRGRCSSPRRR